MLRPRLPRRQLGSEGWIRRDTTRSSIAAETRMSRDVVIPKRLLDHLKKSDKFNLLMIEQPLWNDDIAGHARLQPQLKTSLCLDESILHSRDAAAAIEAGACRIINIKLGRVGGFTESIATHNVCEKAGIPVWCGGMLEAGIGRAHNIAMSTLPNFK